MPTNNFWEPSLEDGTAQSLNDYQRMVDLANQTLSSVTTTNNTLGQQWALGSNYPLWTMYPPLSINSLYEGGKSEEHKTKVAIKVLDKIKESAKPFEVKEEDGTLIVSKADEYRKLGLIKMAEMIERKGLKVWKEFQISAGGYKRINSEELKKFREELQAVGDMTSKRDLVETPLEVYVGQGIDEGAMVAEEDLGVPPTEVLEKLKVAKDSKLFDMFTVLHIKYVPDPILCGKINESNDLYFIAEWGSDVSFADIVKS